MAYEADNLSVIPKYHIVTMDLLNRINTQEFKSGDMLPSELELTQQYGVSRITIRKSLEKLVQDGVIYRIQGKGSFVSDQSVKNEHRIRHSVSCSDLLRSFHLTPTRRVIQREVVPCPAEAAANLLLKEGTPVLLYERVYYGDDDPAIYGRSYISLEHLNGFETYDLAESSMVKIIEEVYGKHIYKANRKLRAMSANNEISKRLQVMTGFPLLHLHFQSCFYENNAPFEDADLYYRTDVIDYLPDIY